jgi:four helix bundle protein
MMIEKNKGDLEERQVKYAVLIIEIAEALPKSYTGMHLAGQMIRSGTSPALNYGEASSAESRRDFIHKIKIVLKELKETRVALRIVELTNLYPNSEKLSQSLKESNELIAIFITSVNTAMRNLRQQ